jgi:hypothetical protein
MAATCPICGFGPASLSPPDAVVALRSLPRRFRAAAAPDTGDDDDDDFRTGWDSGPDTGRTTGPDTGRTTGPDTGNRAGTTTGPDARRDAVLAAAGAAAAAIAALGGQLRRVLIEDSPDLGPAPTPPAIPAGSAADALGRLERAAFEVADLAASQPAAAWSRTGRRDGTPVSAADLLREAVHAGVHQLRVAAG